MKHLFKLLLLAVVVLFSSCQKQESFTYEGKAISFLASTSNINTKTAYQGSTQNGKEAILWEDGDTFTVFSNEASIAGSSRKWANYKVTVSGGVATAVSPVSDELLWGRGLHHFYALYPAGDVSGNTVSATIPASQDLTQTSPGVFATNLSQNGYMAAAADGNPGDPTVLLNFKPMFTTLEFVVGPGYDVDAVVSGFRLVVSEGSRTVLSGKFSATLSAQADPQVSVDYSSATNEIKVNFGESVTVNKGESLKFTILALPAELTDLVAVFTLDGVERSFPLVDQNGNPIVIPAGQKARITALGILDPAVIRPAFSVAIEGQDVTDFSLSVPGPNGTVGLLPGVFTVGDKKIRFSKGNLQAVLENGVITKWQFAENQWDVANNVEEISNGTGVIDQFLISSTAPLNYWGIYDGFWKHLTEGGDIDPQYANNYVIGSIQNQWTNPDFVAGYGSGWTVLNDDEENYSDFYNLLMTEISRENLPHGAYTITYEMHCTPARIEGVVGVVVFPDGYVQPENIPLVVPDNFVYSSSVGARYVTAESVNVYSSTQWSQMEAAGAVFLPAGNYNGGCQSPLVSPLQVSPHQTAFRYEESVVNPGSYIDVQTGGIMGGYGMIRLIQVVE